MYFIGNIIIIEYLKVIAIIDMKQIDIEMSRGHSQFDLRANLSG